MAKGDPCKHCKKPVDKERGYICGKCKHQIHYAKHKDKVLARNAANDAADPRKVNARAAAYRARNLDKVRAAQKAASATYRAENPVKTKEYLAEWRDRRRLGLTRDEYLDMVATKVRSAAAAKD